MTVRKATPKDLYDVLPLIKKFWKEGNYTSLEYDADYMAELYKTYLESPNTEVFLWDKDGDILGLLVCILMPQAFSRNLAAYEMAWYVSPEARGSSAAFRLIKAYEEWAIQNNCAFMNMSRIESVEDEKLHSMYSKLGLEVKEHTYVKELK